MKSNNATISFLFLIACLVIIDVIIKAVIAHQFQPTETVEVMEGYLMIGRIQTRSMAFGFGGGFSWVDVVRVVAHGLLLWFAIRVQRRPVSKGFKYGSAMIVGSLIGTYIDRLLFSGGTPGFRSTDYFLIHPIEGFHSISGILTVVGWVVLIVSMIVSFKDFKVIFSRNSP